jgi:hypothetical protein
MMPTNRRSITRTRWTIGRLLTLVALVIGLALLFRGDIAQATFNPSADITLSADETGANADVTSFFAVDEPDYNFFEVVSFTPADWGVASDADVPDGALVGELGAISHLGLMNSSCFQLLVVDFVFQDATTAINNSFTYDYLTEPVSDPDWPGYDIMASGLMRAVEEYPDFLNDMFDGEQPLARSFGYNNTGVPGTWIPLQFVVFEPGALGYPASRGYPSVTVLQDPTAPTGPSSITDFCSDLSTDNITYGLSKDNPVTHEGGGVAVRTNPCAPGDYTFSTYAESMLDADNDGIENYLDTCPFDWDDPAITDPRIGLGDDDADGITYVCDVDITDPTPDGINDNYADAPPGGTDADGDGYMNRGDNCPQVANAAATDTDADDIGDACDLVGAGGIGLGPTTPDGVPIKEDLYTDVTITGENLCPPAEATPTPTATATATPTGTVVAAVETTLAEDADAGDTEITVADATGFAVGDTIEIGTGATKETNTITAISDKTFTLATPLKFAHLADEPVVKVIPVVLTPTPTVAGDICQPVFPGTYNGRVLIDGKPAQSGYQVTASIDDVQWGSAIISGGRYAMDIPDHMPTVKPCFEGGTITFALNGMTCTPAEEGADEWHAGIRDVDLDCAPVAPPVTPTVAPPTPTPTTKPPATPVATPTVTPAKPPPTGAGGLSGASSGLPLWATALASWAGLMIVVGLGTLVAVKRR